MNIIEFKKISMSEAEELTVMELFKIPVMNDNGELSVIKSNQGRGTYVASLEVEGEVLGAVYFETDRPVREFDGDLKAVDILVNGIIDDPAACYCSD